MRTPALIVALLALLALPAAVAQGSPRQVMSFEAPAELLDYAQVQTVLREIRAFGVHRVRQPVYWVDYAPGPDRKTRPSFDAADPDAYPSGAWDRLDTLIEGAKRRAIKVMLTPTGPVPRWATAARRGHLNRPSAFQFGRFVKALARRYGDDVDMWSVWNEPNQPGFLRPQYRDGRPYSPRLYRGLYRAAYRAIRSVRANRGDKVLLGETAPRGNADDIVRPLAFLRGVACLDADYERVGGCSRLKADGYAHHAYTGRAGPRSEPRAAGDVTIGVLSRLITALDRAGRSGAIPRRLRVYLTQFGVQSHPDRRSGVPLERQPADYAIAEHIAYVNRRVAMFSQYLMRDDAPRETGYRFRGFQSGLRRYNGVRKPAYAAFANPLAVERYGGTDVLWGRIRAQRGETRVTVQRRRPGRRWKLLRRLTTSSRGVYGLRATHRRHQQYRVRWRSRSGRRHTGPPIRAY